MLGTAVAAWAALMALEILFWVEPMAAVWQGIKRRLYRRPGWFFALPAEYVVRLATVAAILAVSGAWGDPITWSAVAGASGRAALVSLALGLALGMATIAWFLAQRRRS